MRRAVEADCFLPDRVAERARTRLFGSPDAARHDNAASDHAISRVQLDRKQMDNARPAAVLIPLIARPSGTTVLLTLRSAHLNQHSGQIAFPGGKIDREDAGPLGAALREAHEEVGLAPQNIEPLGFLAPYYTGTGFRITPVVASVAPDMPLSLNPNEVDSVFEVPLSFLMHPDNHLIHSREWKGEQRQYFAMPYGDHYIWGATAGIIRMLWLRLYAPHPD